MISAMIYNTHRQKDAKALEPKDFMRKQSEPIQPVSQMKHFAEMMAIAGCGTFEEDGDG